MTESFDRDWVISPGETLREWMEENGLSVRVAARVCRMHVDCFERLLNGEEKLTPQVAEALARGTLISARFWLNLERAYRDGLAAGKKDTSRT